MRSAGWVACSEGQQHTHTSFTNLLSWEHYENSRHMTRTGCGQIERRITAQQRLPSQFK